jgi:hypothetical protein
VRENAGDDTEDHLDIETHLRVLIAEVRGLERTTALDTLADVLTWCVSHYGIQEERVQDAIRTIAKARSRDE